MLPRRVADPRHHPHGVLEPHEPSRGHVADRRRGGPSRPGRAAGRGRSAAGPRGPRSRRLDPRGDRGERGGHLRGQTVAREGRQGTRALRRELERGVAGAPRRPRGRRGAGTRCRAGRPKAESRATERVVGTAQERARPRAAPRSSTTRPSARPRSAADASPGATRSRYCPDAMSSRHRGRSAGAPPRAGPPANPAPSSSRSASTAARSPARIARRAPAAGRGRLEGHVAGGDAAPLGGVVHQVVVDDRHQVEQLDRGGGRGRRDRRRGPRSRGGPTTGGRPRRRPPPAAWSRASSSTSGRACGCTASARPRASAAPTATSTAARRCVVLGPERLVVHAPSIPRRPGAAPSIMAATPRCAVPSAVSRSPPRPPRSCSSRGAGSCARPARATGVPDWPRCFGRWIPRLEVHTLIEYVHRALGVASGLARARAGRPGDRAAPRAGAAACRSRSRPRRRGSRWASPRCSRSRGRSAAGSSSAGSTPPSSRSTSRWRSSRSPITVAITTLVVVPGGPPVCRASPGSRRGPPPPPTCCCSSGTYVRAEGAGLVFRDWPLMGGRLVPALTIDGATEMAVHRRARAARRRARAVARGPRPHHAAPPARPWSCCRRSRRCACCLQIALGAANVVTELATSRRRATWRSPRRCGPAWSRSWVAARAGAPGGSTRSPTPATKESAPLETPIVGDTIRAYVALTKPRIVDAAARSPPSRR